MIKLDVTWSVDFKVYLLMVYLEARAAASFPSGNLPVPRDRALMAL